MESEGPVTPSKQQQSELASMAAAVERLAGELALAEEPARFVVVLERWGDEQPND